MTYRSVAAAAETAFTPLLNPRAAQVSPINIAAGRRTPLATAAACQNRSLARTSGTRWTSSQAAISKGAEYRCLHISVGPYGSMIGFGSRTKVTSMVWMSWRALGLLVETKCPS